MLRSFGKDDSACTWRVRREQVNALALDHATSCYCLLREDLQGRHLVWIVCEQPDGLEPASELNPFETRLPLISPT